jgi:hypothetical protein
MKWIDKKSGEKKFFESGCEHNPSPSTARGKRRHEKRTADQKKHAEKMWGLVSDK